MHWKGAKEFKNKKKIKKREVCLFSLDRKSVGWEKPHIAQVHDHHVPAQRTGRKGVVGNENGGLLRRRYSISPRVMPLFHLYSNTERSVVGESTTLFRTLDGARSFLPVGSSTRELLGWIHTLESARVASEWRKMDKRLVAALRPEASQQEVGLKLQGRRCDGSHRRRLV